MGLIYLTLRHGAQKRCGGSWAPPGLLREWAGTGGLNFQERSD